MQLCDNVIVWSCNSISDFLFYNFLCYVSPDSVIFSASVNSISIIHSHTKGVQNASQHIDIYYKIAGVDAPKCILEVCRIVPCNLSIQDAVSTKVTLQKVP